jgi:tetratricopeptide (TPR) repeat protein
VPTLDAFPAIIVGGIRKEVVVEKPIPAWGLYRLLKALERKRFSGFLELHPPSGRVAVGLDDGRILRIESDVKEWGFPAYLMRSRIVSDPIKAERMQASAMLVDAGVIRAEDGARLQSSYLRSVLTMLMPEPFPAWALVRAPIPTGPVPDMPVEPEPELMRAVARRDTEELRAVVAHLRAGGTPTLEDGADACLRYARAQFGESPFLKALRDGDTSVVDDAAVAADDPVRILFALHVAGKLSVQQPAPREIPLHPLEEIPEPAASPAGVSDVEVRLLEAASRMAEENNYEILGVPIDARLSAIRMGWLRQRRQWTRTRFEGLVTPHALDLLEGIQQRLDAARDRLSERNARLQYNRAIDVSTPGLEARLVEIFEARALWASGREALEARDAKGAMSHFEAAFRQDPMEPEYLAGMAEAVLAMPPSDETRERAKELARQALAVDEDLVCAHLALAEALRRGQEWDAAAEHVRRVLTLDPENEEALKLKDRLRKRPADVRTGGFQRKPDTFLDKVRELLRREL